MTKRQQGNQTKDEVLAGGTLDHVWIRISKDLNHTHQKVNFVVSRKEGMPGVELCQDATQTPHVNVCCVWQAHDDLWGAIEATLDVCVNWTK